MEYYFETDDKLGRKKYAEFLKSMLENCDNYRREDSDGFYVIAIDSPWGTGKTRFAKMLRNYLEDRTKEMGVGSRPGKNASFNAIYYNSWETDFSDDALLPLIHSIIKSPEFKAERFAKKSQRFLEKFKGAATAVAKVAIYSAIHNLAGETVTEMVKDAEDSVSQQIADPLKSYEERLNLLDDFKRSLEKVIEHTRQKRLIIIVDELDRCRPTFAIQTLELAKHLFSVDGLIFVFALDIKQLSSSVKTVYGQELDAPGYLSRFFNYIGRIPEPNELTFIANLFASCSCFEDYPCEIIQEELVKTFSDAVSCYHLSLRDISTVFQAYKLMYITFLNKYKKLAAHKNYICLLVIKYKDAELFNRICKDKTATIIDQGEMFKSQEQKNILATCNNLTNMLHARNIKDFDFVYLADGKTKPDGPIKLVDVETLMVKGQLRVHYGFKATSGINQSEFYFKIRDTLSDILFFPDLQQWSILKSLGLMQYYYQQLEMFNFALPADDTETKA